MSLTFNNKSLSIEIDGEKISFGYRRPTKKDIKELDVLVKTLQVKEKEQNKVSKKTELLKQKASALEEKITDIEVEAEIEAALLGEKMALDGNTEHVKLKAELEVVNKMIEEIGTNKKDDESLIDNLFKEHLRKMVPNMEEFKVFEAIASKYSGVYSLLIREINREVTEGNAAK